MADNLKSTIETIISVLEVDILTCPVCNLLTPTKWGFVGNIFVGDDDFYFLHEEDALKSTVTNLMCVVCYYAQFDYDSSRSNYSAFRIARVEGFRKGLYE